MIDWLSSRVEDGVENDSSNECCQSLKKRTQKMCLPREGGLLDLICLRDISWRCSGSGCMNMNLGRTGV